MNKVEDNDDDDPLNNVLKLEEIDDELQDFQLKLNAAKMLETFAILLCCE